MDTAGGMEFGASSAGDVGGVGCSVGESNGFGAEASLVSLGAPLRDDDSAAVAAWGADVVPPAACL